MLDPITLDQLRTLIAVVEEGNFSAGARKLQRVQSAVSVSMANLEAQLGVTIWDRSSKVAVLTDAGRGVLVRGRRVIAEVDGLRAFAQELAGGVEPNVSLCIDSLFPTDALVATCEAFMQVFPDVDLRVDVQTMSSVSQTVLDGGAKLGIVSTRGVRPPLTSRAMATAVRMVPVTAPGHPLATLPAPIATEDLAAHVQIVLSERHPDGVPDQAVLSPRNWRVADLQTKHAMLLRGLGWGNLPEPLSARDLAEGRLVRLRPAAWAEDQHALHFFALHRPDQPLGRAHAWLLQDLEQRCGSALLART